MSWLFDHEQHGQTIAAIMAAIRDAKLASIGGGIAISSALVSWMGTNYQAMAAMVGVGGLVMSATGVVIQLRRHRTLSANEDRHYRLAEKLAIRDEDRKDKEHAERMAALKEKHKDARSFYP